MLKIDSLHKHYKTKSSEGVHALRGINLEFGEKGFVFILGKSGCGKSTLLNILGGLDKFDSGDIIIKSKSGREFKNRDWDSYRNTYVGFVFQDFNIIENYSIAKNIALSLELQGVDKKEVKAKVHGILDKVQLTEYGKRKPAELSGGQKQRIAIARALIKEPEIILADEPTGNLDSETGRKILEILRNLAEEKLVIMVSHDRNSAYKYADRIITMHDGSVVSDELNEGGLKFISDKVDDYRTDGEISRVIRIPEDRKLGKDQLDKINGIILEEDSVIYVPIKPGKTLTEKDLETINGLIEKNEGTQYIPVAKRVNAIQGTHDETLKNRENPAWQKAKPTLSEKFKLIKSKLPFNVSFKMAMVNLGQKKLRLIFAVVLFLAALGLFGFSETITKFSFANSLASSYMTSETNIIALTNTQTVESWDRQEKTTTPFDAGEVEEHMENFADFKYAKLYKMPGNNNIIDKSSKAVSAKSISGFLEAQNLENLNMSLLAGSFPEKPREIMLTDLFAQYYIDEENDIEAADDLVGTSYEIDNREYIISGIADTDYEKYLFLNDVSKSSVKEDPKLMYYLSDYNTLYGCVIVNDEFYPEYSKDIHFLSNVLNFETPRLHQEKPWENIGLTNSFGKLTDEMLKSSYRSQYLFVTSDFKGLKDDEIIVDSYVLSSLMQMDSSETIDEIVYRNYEHKGNEVYEELLGKEYLNKEYPIHIVSNENYVRIETMNFKVVGVMDSGRYNQICNSELMYDYIIKSGYVFTQQELKQMYENEGHYHYKVGVEYVRARLKSMGIETYGENEYWETVYKEGDPEYHQYIENLKAEYDINTINSNTYHGGIYFSENIFGNKLNSYRQDKVHSIVVNLTDDVEMNTQFINYFDNLGAKHTTVAGTVIGTFNDFVESAANIFRYVSLGIAVFAGLLMFMNVSASIMASKSRIGILRAIGATGRDVSTIFVIESIIIAIITFVLANVGLAIATSQINSSISEQMQIGLSLFNSTSIITLEMAALAIIVVLVATFMPVRYVSGMKPIDAIKSTRSA